MLIQIHLRIRRQREGPAESNDTLEAWGWRWFAVEGRCLQRWGDRLGLARNLKVVFRNGWHRELPNGVCYQLWQPGIEWVFVMPSAPVSTRPSCLELCGWNQKGLQTFRSFEWLSLHAKLCSSSLTSSRLCSPTFLLNSLTRVTCLLTLPESFRNSG